MNDSVSMLQSAIYKKQSMYRLIKEEEERVEKYEPVLLFEQAVHRVNDLC